MLLAGVTLEVILDSCHSEAGLRDVSLERPAALGPAQPWEMRCLPPPADILCRHEGEKDELKLRKGFTGNTRSTLRHVLWAEGQDNQTSADAEIGETYSAPLRITFVGYAGRLGQVARAKLIKRIGVFAGQRLRSGSPTRMRHAAS